MNIFMYELKLYRKSIIIWSASIVGLLVMFMAFFPAIAADASLMDLILENYPKEMLKALGMDGSLSLSTIPGYLTFIFVYAQLCLALQSSYYGFHTLSVEERELTADFLMTKPSSRKQIITAKLLAASVSLVITNLFTWAGTFLGITIYQGGHTYNTGYVIVLLSSLIFFQLFFLSIGMLISVMVKKIRSVLTFSIALAFGLYIMNAVRGIVEGELLGIITPFYHFEASYILEHGTYNMPMASISFGVIIVSITSSYILYMKRNIRSL
ncbi:MAG: ABC transporter permease subunit [Bacteroidetes bacterium]|nr:ABC transporter permease subunit [Bacteroidota bacterium]